MNDQKDMWLTIIPPVAAEQFDTLFKEWRSENEELLQRIDPDRFAVDVIRTKDGQQHRRLRMIFRLPT